MNDGARDELKRKMLEACEDAKQCHWRWPASVIAELLESRMLENEGWDGSCFVYSLSERGRQFLAETRAR